jgi:hypothetical protein
MLPMVVINHLKGYLLCQSMNTNVRIANLNLSAYAASKKRMPIWHVCVARVIMLDESFRSSMLQAVVVHWGAAADVAPVPATHAAPVVSIVEKEAY